MSYDEAENIAQHLIDAGFQTQDEVVLSVREAMVEPVAAKHVTSIVNWLWQQRLAEQARWQPVTDVDRLLGAFRALEAEGVVARTDFTCCNTCGMAEIGAQVPANATGFVFFHAQDTERAVEGGGILLSYGAFGGAPDETVVIGHRVMSSLAAHGLSAQWSGSASDRIHVTPLEWQHRLSA